MNELSQGVFLLNPGWVRLSVPGELESEYEMRNECNSFGSEIIWEARADRIKCHRWESVITAASNRQTRNTQGGLPHGRLNRLPMNLGKPFSLKTIKIFISSVTSKCILAREPNLLTLERWKVQNLQQASLKGHRITKFESGKKKWGGMVFIQWFSTWVRD